MCRVYKIVYTLHSSLVQICTIWSVQICTLTNFNCGQTASSKFLLKFLLWCTKFVQPFEKCTNLHNLGMSIHLQVLDKCYNIIVLRFMLSVRLSVCTGDHRK